MEEGSQERFLFGLEKREVALSIAWDSMTYAEG